LTSLQELMLLKIALNKHSVIDGEEPSDYSQTYSYAEYVIESTLDRAVFNSLKRLKWVSEENTAVANEVVVGLTELGFEQFIDI